MGILTNYGRNLNVRICVDVDRRLRQASIIVQHFNGFGYYHVTFPYSFRYM